MRNLRYWMRLMEGSGDELFHGTSLGGFASMARLNKLGAYGGENQASFTRDFAIAERFAKGAVWHISWGQLIAYSDWDEINPGQGQYKDAKEASAYRAEMAGGGMGAVLCFDRAALHRDFEFHSEGHDDMGLPMVDFGNSGDEHEECAFQDITNLDRYVTRIHAPGFDQYAETLLRLVPDADREYAEKNINAGKSWLTRFGNVR